jgi:hypothetical protein
MERQSKEPRSLEAYCRGGQGPPRAVAPFGGVEDSTKILPTVTSQPWLYWSHLCSYIWCITCPETQNRPSHRHMSLFGQAVTGFSPWRPRFHLNIVHERFVMEAVVLA